MPPPPPPPPGGDGGLRDILQAMSTQLVRQNEQIMNMMERQVQPTENDPISLYEKFRKQGAIEFTGLEGPLIADEWIVHTENVFETMKCTGRQKVTLVASMFKDVTDTC